MANPYSELEQAKLHPDVIRNVIKKDGPLKTESYSPSNPPPYPVTSVNGKTGDTVLDAGDVGALPDDTPIPSNTSDLVNDSGFLTTDDFDSGTGYCKMPDGTLIQWGSLIVEQGSTAQYVGQTYQMPVSLSLPIPFVDTNYRVFGSSKFVSGGAVAIGHDVSLSTKSSAYIRAWDYTSRTLSSSATLKIWWIAIGRWKA